jgi:hypothetical protein
MCWFEKWNTKNLYSLKFSQRWLWSVPTPCSQTKGNRCYGGRTSLQLQGWKPSEVKKPAWRRRLLGLALQPWIWRWYISPKRRLTLTELHGIISQKVWLFFVHTKLRKRTRRIFVKLSGTALRKLRNHRPKIQLYLRKPRGSVAYYIFKTTAESCIQVSRIVNKERGPVTQSYAIRFRCSAFSSPTQSSTSFKQMYNNGCWFVSDRFVMRSARN